MQTRLRSGWQLGPVVLGLSLLAACSDSTGGSDRTHNFDSGTGFDQGVYSIAPALDGTGDVWVGGAFSQYDGGPASRIARLHRDGTQDTGFDADAGFDSDVQAIAPIADGSGDAYVGGRFQDFGGNPAPYIVRVKSGGSAASADFGSGFDGLVLDLALNEGQGDLYAGGDFTMFRGNPRERIARVNPDGSNDGGFDTGTGFDPQSASVTALAVARDGTGRVYAGGWFSTFRGNPRSGIVRINPDGSNDGGFDPGSGFDQGAPRDLAIAIDGTDAVYAGGEFTSYRGISRGYIARILPDGGDDATFATGTGFDAPAFCLAVATDGHGDVYVGGEFDHFNGQPVHRIARLNPDGTLDTGFATGSGFDEAVLAIAPAIDGSGDVLVGGNFTHYDGTAVGHIVRLNPNGSLD